MSTEVLGNEEVAQTSVPSTETRPTALTQEDRMRAQVLQLQLQNVQLQMQVMQNELKQALQTRDQLAQEAQKLRVEYLAKYGIDITKVRIGADGTWTASAVLG